MPVSKSRWRSLRLAGALALAVVVLVAATAVALWLWPPAPPISAPPATFQPTHATWRGVFHLHTVRSDGTGTVDEVAAAAARAGLKFIVVTDHGDATRRPDPPTFRSGVLCIDAVEINTTGGHYAVIGMGPAPYPLGGEPADVVDDVRRLGGFGIAAHPLSPRADLAWSDWRASFDGLEWLNGDSEWREAGAGELLWAAASYWSHPADALARLYRRPQALSRWNSMVKDRRLVTIAGADAHARIGFRERAEPYTNRVLFRAPSYEAVFRVASIEVWFPQAPPSDAAGAAAAVLGAIRQGHVHSVVDGIAAPAHFEFTAQSGRAVVGEGDELSLTDPVFIQVHANVPQGGSIVLYRDGAQVHRVRTQKLIYTSNVEGVYRAEAWRSSENETPLPWVVSNPIYVGGKAGPPALELSVAPVGPTLVPNGWERWEVEKGHGATGSHRLEGEVVVLTYGLAVRERVAQSVALAARVGIPAGAKGLSFVGRAGRPMRISVQLRRGSGAAEERWVRSVYLEPEPRDGVVRFGDMVRASEGSSPMPEVSSFDTVLFVVDTLNTSAGSSGAFSLRDIKTF